MNDQTNGSTFRVVLLIVCTGCLLLTPITAAAYLDPTTGSMLISAIVGVIASLILAIKTYWYRLKAFFSRKPADIEAKSDAEAD